MTGFGSGDGIARHVWLHLHQMPLALIIAGVDSMLYLAHLGQPIIASASSRVAAVARRSTLPAAALFSTALFVILLLSVLSIAGGNYNLFIYFRF